MTGSDLFQRIVAALNAVGIPFMLTGSFAASYHGRPRATQDIDLVVDADEPHVRSLVRVLITSGWYVDEDAAIDALKVQSMFNAIDAASGWKIDFIIRKPRAFSMEEFSRRHVVDYRGVRIPLATLEDVMITKLEWPKLGESERQLEDVAALLSVNRDSIDGAYLRRWIVELGLEHQWALVERRAQPIE